MAEQAAATEVVRNCAECKKVISKAKRYYRNGFYYCNKNCFKKKTAKAGQPAENG